MPSLQGDAHCCQPPGIGDDDELGGLLDLGTEAQGPLYRRRPAHRPSECVSQVLWGPPLPRDLRALAPGTCATVCQRVPQGLTIQRGPLLPLCPPFVGSAPTPIPTGSHTLTDTAMLTHVDIHIRASHTYIHSLTQAHPEVYLEGSLHPGTGSAAPVHLSTPLHVPLPPDPGPSCAPRPHPHRQPLTSHACPWRCC